MASVTLVNRVELFERGAPSLTRRVTVVMGDYAAVLESHRTVYGTLDGVPLAAGSEPALLREMADAVRAVRWPK